MDNYMRRGTDLEEEMAEAREEYEDILEQREGVGKKGITGKGKKGM